MTSRDRAASAVLARVAAHGLPSAPSPVAEEALSTPDWRELLRAATAARLLGHLGGAVDSGALPVTAEQRSQLRPVLVGAAARALYLEAALVATADLLDAAGVETRVLKGAALAWTAHRCPSRRHFGDLDLLVRSEDFERAGDVLLRAGLTRPAPEIAPGFDRRFGKSVLYVREDGLQVDLHRTLLKGWYGLALPLEDLWADPVPFEVLGHRLLAPRLEAQFVHACYHAALGNTPPRFTSLRDVAELALGGRLDDDAARATAERWRGSELVSLGVDLSWQTFGLPDDTPLVRWARARTPSRAERRRTALHRADDRRYATLALAALPQVHGWAARGSYLRSLAMPQRAYLGGQPEGRAAWLLRGAGGLLAGLPGRSHAAGGARQPPVADAPGGSVGQPASADSGT